MHHTCTSQMMIASEPKVHELQKLKKEYRRAGRKTRGVGKSRSNRGGRKGKTMLPAKLIEFRCGERGLRRGGHGLKKERQDVGEESLAIARPDTRSAQLSARYSAGLPLL